MHARRIGAEVRNATPTAEDIQSKASCRRNAIGSYTSGLVNFYICLSKMNSSIAECDDDSSSISIELVQKIKLLVADDSLSLLWPILEAHEGNE